MSAVDDAKKYLSLRPPMENKTIFALHPDVLVGGLLDEIERLQGVLQQIADVEHEDIPAPKTPNEGTTWTVLAMAIGLAEKALKEGE